MNRRGLFGAVVAVVMALGLSQLPVQATMQELEQKNTELNQSLEQGQQKITDLEQAKEELSALIAAADAEQQVVADQLAEVQGQIRATEDQLVTLGEELKAAEETELSQRASMKKRIQFLYEDGGRELVAAIFSSENLSEFLNKAEYVQDLSTYDRNMLKAYAATVAQINTTKTSIETEKTNLQTAKTELESKQSELAAQNEEKQKQKAEFLARIDQEKVSMAAVLQSLSQNNAEIEALKAAEAKAAEEARLAAEAAAKAEAEARAAAQAAAAAAQARADAAAQALRDAQDNQQQNPPVQQDGGDDQADVTPRPQIDRPNTAGTSFSFPTSVKTINSGFGYRDLSIGGFDLSFHDGLDFGAAFGDPVYASAAGTVTQSTHNDGGGNYVRIDHGNGYETYYGHLSSYIVGAGDTVSAGQVIGYVGSTGVWTTGPHLHFGIYASGTWHAYDPGPFLGLY